MLIREGHIYYVEAPSASSEANKFYFIGKAIGEEDGCYLFSDWFKPNFTWKVDPNNLGDSTRDVTCSIQRRAQHK